MIHQMLSSLLIDCTSDIYGRGPQVTLPQPVAPLPYVLCAGQYQPTISPCTYWHHKACLLAS